MDNTGVSFLVESDSDSCILSKKNKDVFEFR